MDIKVGKFHLNTDLPKDKAREIFLRDFPQVTVSDLDAELKRVYGKDKPNNASKEATDSDKQHTKTGKGSAGGKQSGANK